ncbi:MAG: formylglycine-generating enzyme family protein [Planctomycetes bacterium]|nr:formylglycine-generating enzyme family protein [Planctomycetota bacterium]
MGPQIKPQFGLVPIGKDPKSGFFEFVNLDTGIAPKRDSDGKIVIKDDMGLVMVLVPGGKFWMGAQKKNPASPNYDPKAFEIESPVHEVTLAPFFISKYEMFEFQWSRLATANSRNHDEQDRVANLPIDNISWDDCSECLPAAGLQLPTESQWEYAARGGTSTPWWTGSDEKLIEKGGNVLRPNAHRIGSFLGNPFGLHDTIGNVFEWCQDGETTYETVVRAGDGLRATARSDHRVIRGCSFLSGVGNARSALRSFDRPTHRINQLGVRPARAITQ